MLAASVLLLGCGRSEPAPADRIRVPVVTVPGPIAIPFGSYPVPDAYAEPDPRAAGMDTVPAKTAFGRRIQRLSEPGGWFPSDNLVSNETSYLHVLPTLSALGVRGGAYVGVGPDQNFSYIAHIRPEIAYIIDIRRDNALHQLLFKAAFEQARNRAEYLSLLLGRPVPRPLAAWSEASIDEIVLYMDTVGYAESDFEDADARLLAVVEGYGYPLSEWDRETVRGIHEAFFEWGLGIRYTNDSGMRSRRYPTWRQLLVQTDLSGERGSYLAKESSFQFVKRLQGRDLVVPVVGDLGGPHALAAIGRDVAARGLVISAFYVSNVEQYLVRGPGFVAYAGTVSGLPFDERSVIIRSYFGRRTPIPQTVPGHFSTQLLERFRTFVDTHAAGGWSSYSDLVTRNAVPLRDQALPPEHAINESNREAGWALRAGR